jgi:hypothetical protein
MGAVEVRLRALRPSLPGLRSALAPQRGRAAAALLVGGYFLLLDRLGGYDAWGRLGIPPMNPNLWFADLRSVTSAWDCVSRGEPLMPVNPCDSWGRPTIYPDVWLLPRHVGLGEEHTVVLGLLILALFFLAALAVVPAGASVKAGAVYGAALCSPAVMLGVERGNVDVLLFALLVLAVLLAARPLASAAVLLLGAVLKLYPVLGIGYLARRPERRYRLAAGAVVVGFAIYLVAMWSSISATLEAVPQADDLSYGVRRTSEWVAALLHQHSVPRLWDAIVIAAVAAVVLLARPWLRMELGVRAGDAASRRDLDLFWAGAGVYVGSFAVLRSFDYRLVFLLLTLPQLLRWAAAGRAIAVVTLLAFFGALWLDAGWSGVPVVGWVLETWSQATAGLASGQPFPAAVVAQVVLFAGLLSGLVATAPSLRRALDPDEVGVATGPARESDAAASLVWARPVETAESPTRGPSGSRDAYEAVAWAFDAFALQEARWRRRTGGYHSLVTAVCRSVIQPEAATCWRPLPHGPASGST